MVVVEEEEETQHMRAIKKNLKCARKTKTENGIFRLEFEFSDYVGTARRETRPRTPIPSGTYVYTILRSK